MSPAKMRKLVQDVFDFREKKYVVPKGAKMLFFENPELQATILNGPDFKLTEKRRGRCPVGYAFNNASYFFFNRENFNNRIIAVIPRDQIYIEGKGWLKKKETP